MMKRSILIVFLLVAGFMSGCATPGEKTGEGQQYTIKTIDGCEYIEYDYGWLEQRVYSLTHKGNCKNPIHYAFPMMNQSNKNAR